MRNILSGKEYTEQYGEDDEPEEEEDEGAKIAKKNLVRKSIESISRVFEEKFGMKTKP
jgi:hypothetical protein